VTGIDETGRQDLTDETDRETINEQAHKVQGLIFERLQQLDKESDTEAERQALKEALTIVRIIMGDQPQSAYAYHNNSACLQAREIPAIERRVGTANYRLCEDCMTLNAQALVIRFIAD
jgi:hypothetical protein